MAQTQQKLNKSRRQEEIENAGRDHVNDRQYSRLCVRNLTHDSDTIWPH